MLGHNGRFPLAVIAPHKLIDALLIKNLPWVLGQELYNVKFLFDEGYLFSIIIQASLGIIDGQLIVKTDV